MNWIERYDIIYFNLYSDYYDLVPADVREKFIGATLYAKIRKILYALFVPMKGMFTGKVPAVALVRRDWVVVDAGNNYESVCDIFGKEEGVTYVTHSQRLWTAKPFIQRLDFSFRMRFVIRMIAYILKRRRRIGDRWDFFITECGYFEAAGRILKVTKPNSILLTNDHTPVNRALALAARVHSIKTGYIQHACVRSDFGALLTDHAFLEGQDSVDKYAKYGAAAGTTIHIIGMPKVAKYLESRREAKMIITVGIAYNTTDDTELVENLAAVLHAASFKVVVRKHPGDDRRIGLEQWAMVSNAADEGVFSFFGRIDALVACESAIHLEAILMNKPSFYFLLSTTSRIRDLYDFIKNGLISYCDRPGALIAAIGMFNQEPADVYRSALYYNGLIDKDESASLAIARNLIRQHLLIR